MNRILALIGGAIVALATGGARAEDCYHMQERMAAAQSGNLSLLYALEADYGPCLQRNRQPQQQVPQYTPPKEPLLSRTERAVVNELGKLGELTQSGRQGLYGSEKLSDVLKQGETPQTKAPPVNFIDPFEQKQPAKPTTPVATGPGISPFTGKYDPALDSTLRDTSRSSSQPTPSLPPPGQLGQQGGCYKDPVTFTFSCPSTFNSR